MKKKLLQNIFSLGTVQLVNYVFPLITVPYVSRIIGPDSYGIINYSYAFIAYFSILIAYGFDLTGTRKIARNPDDNQYVSSVFSQIVNARILLFLASCLLFIVSLQFVSPLKQNLYVTVVIFASTISSVLVPQFIYQGKQHLSIFAVLNFFKGLVNTILIFILIRHKEDFVVLPTLNFGIGLMSSVFLLTYAYKKFNLKYQWIKISDSVKLLYSERVIFFSTVVISIYTTTNTVILGLFANAADVGFFTVSLNLVNIISSVISAPLLIALYPYIGNAFGKDQDLGLEMIRKTLPLVGYLTFTAGIILFIFAPLIIQLFYGSQFLSAVTPFRILVFTPFMTTMSNVFGIQTMLNLNMDKTFFRVTATASVIGLVLNIFMSKIFGYVGTAWNTIIIETFVTTYMYFLLRKTNLNLIDKRYFNPKFVIRATSNVFFKKREL